MDGRFLQTSMTFARKVNDARPDVDCGGGGGLAGPRTLTAGNNVQMCDGSVRYFGQSVQSIGSAAAPPVLYLLCNRFDMQAFNMPQQ